MRLRLEEIEMRLALLAAATTVIGLGACAPLPPAPYYGYPVETAAPAAVPYGYYDGGYAPGPYYGEPAYAQPFVAPGPTIIVGGERRFDDRYRDGRPGFGRPGFDGGYRGRPSPPPDRGFVPAGGRDFGGGPRPSPAPRPSPVAPAPGPRPGGGPIGGNNAVEFNPASPGAHGGADR